MKQYSEQEMFDSLPDEMKAKLTKEMRQAAMEQMLLLSMYTDVTIKMLNDIPELGSFLQAMTEIASKDETFQQHEKMFKFAFVTGFAKALQDMNEGRINLQIVKIDKGENNEDDPIADHPCLRRNQSPRDGQSDPMDAS